MNNAVKVVFLLVTGGLHCGGTAQNHASSTPEKVHPVAVSASTDPMDYMPSGSNSLIGGRWDVMVKSGFLDEKSFPRLDKLRTRLQGECALNLDKELQSVVVSLSGKEEQLTVAIESLAPQAQLQSCLEVLRTGESAWLKDWNFYWPSNSLVILSAKRTEEELWTLGRSKRETKTAGLASQMKVIDLSSPLWLAMRISPKLAQAASLPLSPAYLLANIRLSGEQSSDFFIRFSDDFGIESAVDLFAMMKPPLLARLKLDNDVLFDAKRIGRDLRLTVGHKVLTRGSSELLALAEDLSQPRAPGDLSAPDDVAKPPSDAQKTQKGVYYKMLSTTSKNALNRDLPSAIDTVTVHYTGWTTDGKMFDSSRTRGKATTFPLTRVIAGWTDGLQQMAVGETFRFWIPEDLAYKGRNGAPKGMLVFDVELLSILRPPKVPNDLKRAPRQALRTSKGINYKYLKRGKGGQRPNAWDKVTVHYSGWTQDGNMFDSTITRGNPATFPLSGVIAGWSDVMQQMQEGDSVRAWISKKYAYKGAVGKPKGMLVFDIELLKVERMPKPPPAPRNVRRAPKSARRTALGTRYKVLKRGSGASPNVNDRVEVHYTGWTTDGKMFDSSITRNRSATFPLTAVIPGWTDGLQTMRVGGKTRFWIPEKLAYKGRVGKPAGTLVFDVELLSISPP